MTYHAYIAQNSSRANANGSGSSATGLYSTKYQQQLLAYLDTARMGCRRLNNGVAAAAAAAATVAAAVLLVIQEALLDETSGDRCSHHH